MYVCIYNAHCAFLYTIYKYTYIYIYIYIYIYAQCALYMHTLIIICNNKDIFLQ